MKTKKRKPRSHEPLLNTFARKIGHAAGAVSKMTQELTETLSAVPKAVTARMQDAAKADRSTERPGRRRSKKKAFTSRKRSVKETANKPSRAIGKSRRRRRKPAKTAS